MLKTRFVKQRLLPFLTVCCVLLAIAGHTAHGCGYRHRSDKLAPDREQELGKMLVAAVQLELFQMLDDICEAGDIKNELFDDLCSDTIQDGRRAGFIFLTVEVLISPGSGYKRLLQIRKDQVRFCATRGRAGGRAGRVCRACCLYAFVPCVSYVTATTL